MKDNTDAWLKRAKEVLAKGHNSTESIPFCASILGTLYGPGSAQLEAFNSRMQEASRLKENAHFLQVGIAYATLKNVVAEIEQGLIVNFRAQIAGEVLSELVSLGKEILTGNTDASKNVAAVLIAAAFEDIIRRMGTELAGVQGKPDLQDVVTALKTAQVLKGGEISTAVGHLKFRNDSLHADWAQVHKFQVESCIAFIESLLLKHFS